MSRAQQRCRAVACQPVDRTTTLVDRIQEREISVEIFGVKYGVKNIRCGVTSRRPAGEVVLPIARCATLSAGGRGAGDIPFVTCDLFAGCIVNNREPKGQRTPTVG